MPRFRKKSDAKPPRSPESDWRKTLRVPSPAPPSPHPPSPLPVLTTNDFRTSLILPSLERRFTLLRASNGSPLSLENMKNKFAIQRAKNAEFTISEDEELVILDQLQRIRENSTPTTPLHDTDHLASPSSSMFSSQSRSPTSPTRRARQYGGGLFSSSQSTDTRLFRKMARSGSDRSLVSKTSGESFMKHAELVPSSPRPIRTEEMTQTTTSSSNGAGYISDKTPIARQLNLQPSTSPPPTLRHDRNRSQADIARISMALSNVMKEIEEEGILDPDFKFSTTRSRDDRPSEDPQGSSVLDSSTTYPKRSTNSSTASHIVEDDVGSFRSPSPYARTSAVSPTPRIPGYIPGMPRPLTPKSFENEDPNRPRSTTPRAYSPFPAGERPPPQGILRRGSLSNNTRALPRTDSPVFVGSNRRKNEPSFSHSQNPSYDRDRPLSPLSFAGSPGGQARSSAVSRNDDWRSNMSTGSHYRDGSSSSSHMYTGFAHERSFSGGQSLSAPALPDSPLLDMTHPALTSINESTRRSPMGSMDFNSPPLSAQSTRSGLASSGHSRFQASIDAFDRPEAGSRTLSPKPEIREPLASPLVLTSLQNSSQTSLLSTGSSYHSIRDAARQASDAAFSLISQSTPGTTPDTQEGYHPGWISSSSSTQVDEALQLLGLTQENLVAMQDKLVQMASPDLVLTPQSPVLRRRKNSIPNRVTSPVLLETSEMASEESKMKLLASMLNSIESTIPTPQAVSPPSPETPELVNPLDSYVDVGRSALAGLADALFGRPQEEIEEELVHVPSAGTTVIHAETEPFSDPMKRRMGGKSSEPQTPSSDQRPESEDDQIEQWGHVAPPSDREDGKPQAESVEPLSSLSSLSASDFLSEDSIQEIPPTSQTPRPTTDEAGLVEDITRRAAEATAALKSVSQTRLEVPSQVTRKRPLTKRVAVGHISSPQLIAPPSRMNTYTIYSPSSSDLGNVEQRSPSKLSQQMKKFTGSFRGTKSPNGEEVTPWVYNPDSSNSPDEQNPASMDASFTSSGSLPFHAGNSSDDRLRQPATPSTASPLSPGPSLRNLFGRFRKPKRELHIDPFKMSGNELPPIELTQSRTSEHKGSITSNLLRRPSTSQSGAFLHKRLQAPIPVTSPGSSQLHMKSSEEAQSDTVSSPAQATENDEVKKLFAAASNLGLDQAELTRLLSRSASISSHSPGATLLTTPSRTPSESTRPTTIPSSIDENSYSLSRSTSLKKEGKGHRRTPSSTDFGIHTDDSGMIDTDQTITVKRARSGSKRKTSIKKITGASSVKRGQSIYDDPDNLDGAIVRRTLIIPGNGEDGGALAELEGLLQKNAKTRKRGSLTSTKTSRDVHDRVPTPPPSRARRFSAGKSSPVPPVPGITTTLASPTFSSFSGISRASESQRGNFDSFYDMYDESENQEQSMSTRPSISRESGAPTGPALQLLELANGETIWSIVNDLRNIPGDDMASLDRQSFSSEFSRAGSPSYDDTMQLRFKEHKRQTSKSSVNSLLSSVMKNSASAPPRSNAPRPETKVFMSTTNQIGRLIDSLSKGMDAGSFNILPMEGGVQGLATPGSSAQGVSLDRETSLNRGHRPTSSLRSDLSVDAQLEQMIGKLNGSNRSGGGKAQ